MTLYTRHTSPAGKATYRPWGEVYHREAWEHGHHLVTVSPGLTTIAHRIEPAHAELLAAAEDVRGEVLAAITAAMEPVPTRELTPAQAIALRGVVLRRASPAGVFEALVGGLVGRIANAR